jgi:hypothetical protein
MAATPSGGLGQAMLGKYRFAAIFAIICRPVQVFQRIWRAVPEKNAAPEGKETSKTGDRPP